jgi:hypothetical protein
VLQLRSIAYVPCSLVKEMLCQLHVDVRKGKRITKIQEYDMIVKPTKLIKGQ